MLRDQVHANLTAPALVAEAVHRGEGLLAVEGRLVVTGAHTGRTAQDKFVVDEPSVTDEIWWGKIKQPPRAGEVRDAQGARPGLSAGTGAVHPGPLRRRGPAAPRAGGMVTTEPGSLFARNMFIRPRPEELADFEPDYIILHAPKFQADPAIDGVRTGTSHRAVVRASGSS